MINILYLNVNLDINHTMLDIKLVISISNKVLVKSIKFDYYNTINIALEKYKTSIIYTFFEIAFDNKSSYEIVKINVEEWENACIEAGWQPIILNLKDAKKYPRFTKFKGVLNNSTIKEIEYEKIYYYQQPAVATYGRG